MPSLTFLVMPISRSGRFALLLASAVALAGCGSTAQMKGQASDGSSLSPDLLTNAQSPTSPAVPDVTQGGGGLATPGTAVATARPNTAPAAPLQGAGSSPSSPNTVTSTVGAGGTKSVTTTTKTVTGGVIKTVKPTVPDTGKGWDKKYVYVGVVTANDVNAVAKQLGLKSIDGGDQEGEATAMVNAINANGGIFGRKVKLVFHDVKGNDVVTTPETVAAATCQFYANDHPVVAILSPVGIDTANFRACMLKNKIAFFSVNTTPQDNVIGQANAPYYYQMVSPSWNGFAPTMVSMLRSQGYFSGWDTSTNQAGSAPVKVGVLAGITDVSVRVGKLVASSLKAYGYDPVVYNNDPKDFTAAVLKMSGSGVTHLVIPDGGQALFMLTAATQKYFPRYGLSSADGPEAVLASNIPAAVLHGSMGAGWSPSLDVNDANDPGDTSSAETTCKGIFSKAGFDFTGRRLAEAIAFSYCDGLRIISEGATAGVGLTPLSIYQGVVTIAPTWKSALSFGSGLTPTHLTIPGAVRPFAFVDSCTCFRYTSTKNTLLP